MKNTVYRYTIRGNYAADCRSLGIPVEGNGLWVDRPLRRDEIIGGVCKAIKQDTLELIYEIWEIDENKLKHPSVSNYQKVEIEVEPKIVKLPSGKPKKTNWKSANRGGGVKHKDFDKKATKDCYAYLVKTSLDYK
jgi:hypothetical protein